MLTTVRMPIICFVLTGTLGACVTSTPDVSLLTLPADANDLLTVDCLLPGRIRQLGQGRIYQEPHRPIKTSGSLCAIRGGDFVRYDRANFRTSLNVWLDAAKSGDPEAQTYVGEIFEKGMGVDSDYAEAARWYAMAAELGYDRARINLGYLYETGLGVDKDVTRALNLYRDAAGLSDGSLEYVANADLTARRKQQTSLAQTREQLAQAEQRLAEVEHDFQAQQSTLQRTEQSLRELQQAADDQRIAVARQRQFAVGDDLALHEAMTRAEQLSDDLATARDSEHDLQAQLGQYQQQAGALQLQLDAVLSDQQARAVSNRDSSEARQRFAQQLEAVERDRLEIQAALAAQRAQVAHLEQRYAEQSARHRSEVESLQHSFGGSAAEAEHKLAELEKELSKRSQIIAELNEKLSITGQALLQATVVKEIPRADAVNPVDYDGLSIELVNLKTEILRSGTLVALLPDRSHQKVIGQIRPSQSLARLDINDSPYPWDVDGVFSYTRDAGDQMDVIARDTSNQPFHRSFRLREPLELHSTDSDTPGNVLARDDSLAESVTGIDFGNFHALIVGNSEYRYFNSVAPAVPDARRLDQVLRNRYEFNTQVLLDAGKADLLATMAAYQNTLSEQDNFLLYFSGLCRPATVFSPQYWLLHDADPKKNETWLSLPSLVAIIDAMPARNILIIADACSPQTLTSTAVPIPAPGEPVEQRVSWFQKMIDTRARSVLASGVVQPWPSNQQIAGSSPFTVALLEALETEESVLEASRLYTSIREASVTRFRQLLSGADVRYAPIQHAGHEGGEFLFVRRDLH